MRRRRKRKFHKKKRSLYSAIIVLLFVSIGIGYSIINSTINMNGSFGISKVTWSVHFTNPNVLEGASLQDTAYTLNADNTQMSLDLTFVYPGDVFKMYVEVINEGTLDAMLNELSVTGLTTDQKKLITYEVTYSDGTPMATNDILESGKKVELLITISYGIGLSPSEYPTDDQDMSVNVKLSYVQNKKNVSVQSRTLNMVMARKSSLDSASSKYVTADTGIKFSEVGSTTNGMGVYTRSGTENNTYPIYYFRGPINDNHVKFANICWRIVRTTDTGGVKLIYNGIPASDGTCDNTGEASQIEKVIFNTYTAGSIADVGYHYGARYEVGSNAMLASLGWVYGNDVTYSNGTYTLVDTITTSLGWNSGHTSVNEGHHYTCLSKETSCSTVYYIFYAGLTTASYYLPLTGGQLLNPLILEMTTNTTNANPSNIKTYIENWYNSNLTAYTSKLEDTVWCNDRSIYDYNGWDKDTKATLDGFYFSAYNRVGISYTPSVACSSVKDKFTVSTSKGNGLLNYPIGLITADEAILASGGNNSWLFTGNPYWTMTPSYFAQDGGHVYFFDGLGLISAVRNVGSDVVGVRPAISLKPNLEIVDGSGSASDPYIIN